MPKLMGHLIKEMLFHPVWVTTFACLNDPRRYVTSSKNHAGGWARVRAVQLDYLDCSPTLDPGLGLGLVQKPEQNTKVFLPMGPSPAGGAILVRCHVGHAVASTSWPSVAETGCWDMDCDLVDGEGALACAWGWEILTRYSQVHLNAYPKFWNQSL